MQSPTPTFECHLKDISINNETVELDQSAVALRTAASHGDKNTLRKLIDNGLKILEMKNLLGQTSLICSITDNQLECASVLLKAGSRVDNRDNSGQTALHIAVNKGLHRCVKLLLSSGALWHQKDLEGVTALHLASIHISSKSLALILKELKPGEIDMPDSSEKTALHWSAAYTNVEHIRLLLDQDANISIPDIEGKTPLHWAATSADPSALECVKILLEKEPSVINWQDYEGRSALHLAVASGTIETIAYLTSKENCDINILDNMFSTPLHWAAKLGFTDIIGLLLDMGAACTSSDGHGATPLHYAAHDNNADAIRIFLSRNYITDEPDFVGRNAFIWAAARKANDVIHAVAENGVDLTFGDKNGITALHAAAIQGHVSTVELLLELKAPVDIKDKAGLTPFLQACEMGKTKVAQVLLNSGACLSATDSDNRTCIHLAAKKGHAYLCQILLHNGCVPNKQDSFGMTPLHYASLNGYVNSASVLLEFQANPDISDNEGKTPLHWAVLNNHLDVVKLLCECDAFVNSMAFLNGWATPLDCALHSNNNKISEYLQDIGGLSAIKIEEIAALKIQAWFQRIRTREKNCLENNSNMPVFFRSFSTKSKFCKMQEKIKTAFPTDKEREAAENEWRIQLANFLAEL